MSNDDALGEYYAYYTGAPALRVVLKARIERDLKKREKPKGRAKKKKDIMFTILGSSMKIGEEEKASTIIDRISQAQAKRGVQGLPLSDPSGCSWETLWKAYQEKYS